MKIGIIGLGARISTLAGYLKAAMPEAEFAAFADISQSPPGLPFISKANNGTAINAYSSAEQMFKAEQFDFVMIGSPNNCHLGHIEDALKSGTPHIFTEKPVVTNEKETFELLKLIQDHNALDRLMVGLVLRYSPLYRELISAQQQNLLGNITSIEASELIPPHHGSFFMRDWRRHIDASGGFMLEKCVHDLDLYQGLIGARPQYVSSFGGRKSFVADNKPEQPLPKPDITGRVYPYEPRFNGAKDAFNSDADIIDYQTANIQYQNGTVLGFHTNLNAPDEKRHFCVMGSKGQAQGDFVKNYFTLHESATGQVIKNISQADTAGTGHYGADEAMVADIAKYLKHGTPLPVSILDALEAGLCAIKIDEAMAAKQVIDLTNTWQKFDSYNLKPKPPAPIKAPANP